MGMTVLATVPVTVALAAAQVAVWTFLVREAVSFARVGLNYDAVVARREYWRLAIAPLAHVDYVHLFVNVWTLWQFGGAQECALGSARSALATAVLALASQGVELALYHALIKRCRLRTYARLYSLGFSGVLVAWITVAASAEPEDADRWALPLGLSIAPALAPLVAVLVIQVLVKRASLVGHVAGLLAGLAVYSLDYLVFAGALLALPGGDNAAGAEGGDAGGVAAAADGSSAAAGGAGAGAEAYWYLCTALLLCAHLFRRPVLAGRPPPFVPVEWVAPDRMVRLDRPGPGDARAGAAGAADAGGAARRGNPLRRIREMWEQFERRRRQRRQRSQQDPPAPPAGAADPPPPS